MNLTHKTNTIVLMLASVAAIIAVFMFVAPVPQDLAYHNFSDTRMLFGIDNFWNVSSNLPFLLVGVAGLYYIYRHRDAVCVSGLEAAYRVFFIGILLTAFGSGYYHLAPGNNALIWDRLPMTIGFAGLFSIIVGEFVSVRAGRRLLLPLLVVGLASVEYWAWTETRGGGDLRPYAIVQFLPMMLIPVILLSYRPVTGTARYFWWMFAFYFAAKLFEQFDAAIFAVGHLISGHSLKHIAAALTPAAFLYALTLRRHDSRGA